MNYKNVSAAAPKVGGAVFRAPVGTTLPTDATTALNAAFKDMGCVSEDGVTNSNSPESDVVKTWGGGVAYAYQTAKADTFKLVLLESLNPDTLKAIYGSENVSGALVSGIAVKANATEQEEAAWVIESLMRGAVKRIVIPCGKITEIGDVVYVDGEPVGYEITIMALPDDSGNTHYEYIKANAKTTGVGA